MKTNKINVVLSLSKTTISRFEDQWDDIIGASGQACGTGQTAHKSLNLGNCLHSRLNTGQNDCLVAKSRPPGACVH